MSVQIYFHSYSTLPYFVIWKKSVPAEKSMRQKAKEQFVILADQILTACNMAVISEKYELDSLLLLGFQEDDCYLYEELAEQLVIMKMD